MNIEVVQEICDANGNIIYCEFNDGGWVKKAYDDRGNQTYHEESTGIWEKREYDQNNNLIYREYNSGEWERYEYDEHGKETYYENSDGIRWGTPRAELEQEQDIEKERVNNMSKTTLVENIKRTLKQYANGEITVEDGVDRIFNDYINSLEQSKEEQEIEDIDYEY